MPKVKKKCNNDLFIILAVLGAVYAVFLAIVFKINGYIWFQNEYIYRIYRHIYRLVLSTAPVNIILTSFYMLN